MARMRGGVSQSYRHVVRVGSLSACSNTFVDALDEDIVFLYTYIIGMLRVWYRERTHCDGWSQ